MNTKLDYYRFVYRFSKDGIHKTIETEVAIQMLELVCGGEKMHICNIVEFLKQSSFSYITFDQWNNFLEFSNQIDNDFGNYDPQGACT